MSWIHVTLAGIAGAAAGFFAAFLLPNVQQELEKQRHEKAMNDAGEKITIMAAKAEQDKAQLEALSKCSPEFQAQWLERKRKEDEIAAAAAARAKLNQNATYGLGTVLAFVGSALGMFALSVWGNAIARGMSSMWSWARSFWQSDAEVVAEAVVAQAA